MQLARLIQWMLVSIAITISFVLCILSLTTPRWATSDQYINDVRTPDNPDGIQYGATNARGAFNSKTYKFVIDPGTGNATKTTIITSGQICTADAWPFENFAWFCQQLTIGVKVLIAGSIFGGLAMITAFTALLVSCARTRANRSPLVERILQKMMFLTAILAALGVGLGGLIVTNTLVNEQSPDGDFLSHVTIDALLVHSHWQVSRGAEFAGVAFLLLVLSLMLIPSTSRHSCRDHASCDQEFGRQEHVQGASKETSVTDNIVREFS